MDYQVLEKRLYSEFPIFGSCIRQRTAQALADDGTPEAVRLLAKAGQDSEDRKVVAIALECLRNLRSQDSINAFCRIWADTRHKDLTAILKSRRYVSTNLNLRVLSALKAEALDLSKSDGVEILDPLLSALSDKDTQIANTAANCIIKLKNKEVIDELCKRWANSRNSKLEQILREGNYIANNPIDVRVLTALKFDQHQLILNKGIEVLEPLLEAIQDQDPEIRSAAGVCIRQLKNKQMIDTLCKKWIESPSFGLEEVIRQANFEPTESTTKALFYFLSGEWQKYEDLDFDQSLLTKAYYSASEKVKKSIANKAIAAGRIEWIKILSKANRSFNVDRMTDADWAGFIDILAIQPDIKEIWRFLYNAPAIWGKVLLDKISNTSSRLFNAEDEVLVKNLSTLASKVSNKNFEELRYTLFSNSKHIQALTGHIREVRCLAINPDGHLLVSGGWDKTISLWSLSTGKHIQALTDHINEVRCLAINPDGQLLVSGSDDKTIRLWRLPDGKHIQTLVGHDSTVSSLAISPDGQLLVSGSDDKTIRLWRLPDGKHIQTLTGHDSWVSSLAISPDGQLLVSGSWDRTIRLWRLPSGKHIQTLIGHSLTVRCLAISPDGQLLVSGSWDQTIRLWRLPDGKHIQTLTGHDSWVSSLAISPDGQLLVSGSGDKTIRLWKLPDGKHVQTLTGHMGEVRCLAISPDGQLLVSGSDNRTIWLWNLPHHYPISKYTLENILTMENKVQDFKTEEGIRNALKFTLALIRLRQEFDIDIEEVSSNIELNEFDIEIDG